MTTPASVRRNHYADIPDPAARTPALAVIAARASVAREDHSATGLAGDLRDIPDVGPSAGPAGGRRRDRAGAGHDRGPRETTEIRRAAIWLARRLPPGPRRWERADGQICRPAPSQRRAPPARAEAAAVAADLHWTNSPHAAVPVPAIWIEWAKEALDAPERAKAAAAVASPLVAPPKCSTERRGAGIDGSSTSGAARGSIGRISAAAAACRQQICGQPPLPPCGSTLRARDVRA